MKQHVLTSIRLTLFCMVLFMAVYPLLILTAAQLAPAKGSGETVMVNGQVKGWKHLGQSFTADSYFWSRPSAVSYNAAGAGGSNKGPSNPDYLQTVKDRIDTFLVHNPGIKKEEIPAEMVTASGSGLDPDITPAGAYIQVKRIAVVRGISEEKIRALVEQHIEKSWIGPAAKINVLKLNVALDAMK
jgi:potassium-transporting ATPase KdpC subunit